MEETTLIFLHIPKAAGTTLHHVIDREYSGDSVFHVDGGRVRESIDRLRRMPGRKRDAIRCLKGHMPFGLHTLLKEPCRYVTLLRDPVDRVVSHYYHVLRSPDHYLHDEVVSRQMTLRSYVESGLSAELQNGQTRLIAGTGRAAASPDSLESAKQHLDRYFIVAGLVERFDESLVLMKRRLGWGRIWYAHANATPDRPSRSGLDRDTVARIREMNPLDHDLYEHVRRSFDEQVQQEGEPFRAQVTRFRRLNRFLGPLYGLAFAFVHSGTSAALGSRNVGHT